MQPLKRKDSCTFKREKTLEVQERIYPLLSPGAAYHRASATSPQCVSARRAKALRRPSGHMLLLKDLRAIAQTAQNAMYPRPRG
jgi:hypothetical protein